VGLEIVSVAPKAEHVAVAEALDVDVAKLGELEAGGMRREVLGIAIVDEQ
jgi:hypothetical protein